MGEAEANGWRAEITARVDSGASIGAGTMLWDHVHVRAGAVLGADCNLGKNVYIDADVHIGDRVKIQNNVSVYRGVTLGNDVFLGPSCVFTNDLYPRAGNVDWQIVETHVDDGASIGANATIVCGNSLGSWCVVAAGSVVTHDVESHQLVRGNPARPAGWVCRCGRVVSRSSERPETLECATCREGS